MKNDPYVSISIQLEAEKYPGLKTLIEGSGIKKYIKNHIRKHLTLVVMKVPLKDILKVLKINKLTKKYNLDTISLLLQKFMESITSNYVLKIIKPVVDKLNIIELDFIGLKLWPSGHLVGVFNPNKITFKWIVHKMRELMKKTFPNGIIMRLNDMIPHITLGRYNIYDKSLFKKLKQPKNKVKGYRVIKKQWRIYPTIRLQS